MVKEFVKSYCGKVDNQLFTLDQLIEMIETYEQVKERMNIGVMLDDRDVSMDEWIRYNTRYQEWLKKDYKDAFERGMSQPNAPNYFRANND